MRLGETQQREREAVFWKVLAQKLAAFPSLEVRADFPDEGRARAVAGALGLRQVGATVSGLADAAVLQSIAARSWRDLQITSAERPLLRSHRGEFGVALGVDDATAHALSAEIASAIEIAERQEADAGSTRAPGRTFRAALILGLDYLTLAVLILVGILIYRFAEDSFSTVVSLLLAIVLMVGIVGVLPIHAVGNAARRTIYRSADSL